MKRLGCADRLDDEFHALCDGVAASDLQYPRVHGRG